MAQEPLSDQQARGNYNAQASQGSNASVNIYSTSPPPTDLNRHRLLAKVRTFWITGVLEQSLQGIPSIDLALQEQSDATMNPWRLIVQEADHPLSSLPSGTLITQVYDQTEGELLILGAPGAGKTTLLLQLARDLINRAKQDESHPLPVVLNLSSWATKGQPLAEWLVDELNSKYQVPQKLAQEWIAEDKILPLLDGLDEVKSECRTACVETINTYRQEHGLGSMVVCCRGTDYDALGPSTRLLLHSAIVVQPLNAEQIDEYLASGGEKLFAIREMLQTDPDLQEMVTTPLMLSVLMLAYAGKRLDDLVMASSPQLRRQQLFATYVERMLHRRGPKTHYTPQQVKHWLSWLAQQMTQHGQTEFYLERMQPDWLSPARKRLPLFFGALVRVSIGLVFGLIAWLTFWLHNMLLSSNLPHSSPASILTWGLIFALISGTVYGLVCQVETSIKPAERIAWSGKRIWQRLRESEAVFIGLLFGLFGAVFGALNPEGPLESQIGIPLNGLFFGLFGGFLFCLFRELMIELVRDTQKRQTHATVQQGGWHSLYNHVLVGVLFGLFTGLIFGLLTALFMGVIDILAGNLSGTRDMLKYGLMSGLSMWVVSGLYFGGKSRVETGLKPVSLFAWLCKHIF